MDLGKEMKEIMKDAIIKFLRNIDTDKDKTSNVINFLQRGWKYEEMWEDLKNFEFNLLHETIEVLEQKYFPKVVK